MDFNGGEPCSWTDGSGVEHICRMMHQFQDRDIWICYPVVNRFNGKTLELETVRVNPSELRET